MPIYEYECRRCGQRTETMQRMGDPPLAECAACGGELRKLISAPAFQFKGTGWYVSDYGRKGADGGEKSDKGEKAEKAEKGKAAGGESGGESGGASGKADAGKGEAAKTAAKEGSGSSSGASSGSGGSSPAPAAKD